MFEDKNYRVEVGASLIICTSNYASENEVREALGEALYSRLDALIRFKPLSTDEIQVVIDRLVDARSKSLEPAERTQLDQAHIKGLLRARVGAVGNVRRLGKLVDGVISTLLVRAILPDQVLEGVNVAANERDGG